ncbi:MAG: hypothetical protein EBR94_01295 [Bacteroidetes bacterium]|nr:hypothetical protein [Bacteroidota bacterium]
MNQLESLKQHRQSLISEGVTATFQVPLMFSKAFVGQYTNKTGDIKTGRIIEGIASTEDKDQQGEIVIQDKMDCSYLLEKGYLNWNHSHAPEDQIGKPLEVIKLPGGPNTPNGLPATFFRALLFESMPRSEAVWGLSKALEDASGIGEDRFLGFSVEGGVRVRHGTVLAETVVRHMAATHEPVNAQSVARCVIAKSQGFKVHDSVLVDVADNNVPHFIFKSFGHLVQSIEPNVRKTINLGDVGALKKEYLARSSDKKTSPEYILSKLYTECKDGRNCKKNDRFAFGKRGALDHLVHCANMDPNEAADILALALKILH